MKAKRCSRVQLILLSMTILTVASYGWSDCGSIPFYSPFLIDLDIETTENSRAIRFDPLDVTVFEPQQRAIILWNGQEEILLLSTDQRASRKSAVLEVIPLPSKPAVRPGSFATFEEAQRLMVEKRMWVYAHGGAKAGFIRSAMPAGRIEFQRRMGAHDLTVAEVLDREEFTDFVQTYLQKRYRTPEAPIRPEFVKIIQSYLDEGFRWFAFDVIQLDGTTKSREPIEYRFKSECVYYPMRISNLERGETKVDLLVFTAGGASRFEGLPEHRMGIEPQVGVTLAELEQLSKAWRGFFGASPELVMDQWTIEGDIATFASDVMVK